MKRILVTIALGALLAAPVWAQEGEQPQTPSPEQMAKAMEMMQPGEHHQQMAKLVGKWKAKIKMWPAPGADPMESDGVSETASVMGGRYFQTSYEGSFMGMPFNGMGIDGYDKMKQKHVGIWVDTMGTGIMSYEGDCSDDHKVVTTWAELDDPMTGQRVKMRQVTTQVDDDHFTYEAYAQNPEGEGEMKVMEISYERM